jgi:S1-C subfamily serine protease
MLRALAIAALFLAVAAGGAAQTPGVLHIKVVLVDASGKEIPLPRHALLISDNPPTTTPRRVVTGLDGTAEVRLPAGNYTVESDEPAAFQGKAYQWTKTLNIVAGREAVLQLTAANAEVSAASNSTGNASAGDASAANSAPSKPDLSTLLAQWQDSVVGLWTPTTHASGFVIDANGLVATSQRAIGTATSVEVQLTASLKVAGSVLVADADHDAAVLWIDPQAAAAVRPVPLACGKPSEPVKAGDEIIAIVAPLGQQNGPEFGVVGSVEARTIVSDYRLPTGGAGGPVFGAAGTVIGITSLDQQTEKRTRENTRVVRVEEVCGVVAAAERKMKDTMPPSGAPLPVESMTTASESVLKEMAKRRVGSLNPFPMASTDFDVAFITPVMLQDLNRGYVRPQLDFSNWSEYVANTPPVLLIRVTPKMEEGFWTKVARGAAQTQGVALPPFKRIRAGFLRMRAYCGDKEVTPIHPFRLEQRISETDAIYEGLYVYDPASLGPSCASVTMRLYSEKEPAKEDTRVVDPKVIQQIWQDFEPFRASK